MPFGIIAPDIGIDLGTSYVRLFVKGKGIVLSEPTLMVVSADKHMDILAAGEEARIMLGRTTENILPVLPISVGVIADFEMTVLFLRYMIRKAIGTSYLSRPRVAITVPCGLTPVERRAVEEATKEAGTRQVHIVEQPFAAAIGTGLPVYDPRGSLVLNVGGGVTEADLISLGSSVVSRSVRVAGMKMDDAIVNYLKKTFGILINERIAQDLKMDMGNAVEPMESQRAMLRGRDLVTGLPMTVEVTSLQIYEALQEVVEEILLAIRWVLERTPPELATDVLETGIYLTGGGAQLMGLAHYIATELGIPVLLAREPEHCAVLGVGHLVEDFEQLRNLDKAREMEE